MVVLDSPPSSGTPIIRELSHKRQWMCEKRELKRNLVGILIDLQRATYTELRLPQQCLTLTLEACRWQLCATWIFIGTYECVSAIEKVRIEAQVAFRDAGRRVTSAMSRVLVGRLDVVRLNPQGQLTLLTSHLFLHVSFVSPFPLQAHSFRVDCRFKPVR